MWLLNAKTLSLEYFADEAQIATPYAILSHVWVAGQEVSFQEMQAGIGKEKTGYAKIVNTCRLALEHHCPYAWVDTCCIDKSSSAELSEAINSMYRWYFRAKVCFAYLADIPNVELKDSKWFTRGWTLQELVAPRDVEFYDANWAPLGRKIEYLDVIGHITGIHVKVLKDRTKLSSISVAARMSWAAFRQTTREEDRAYSLMGIFDINMPMLYGEGQKAFIRLQEEIMRNSADHSILAWERESGIVDLLASSPHCFHNAGSIFSWSNSGVDESFAWSNRGLRITLPTLSTTSEPDSIRAFLNCRYAQSKSTQICLSLKRQQSMPIAPARQSASVVCELAASQWDVDYFLDVDPTKLRICSMEREYLENATWMDLLILRKPSKTEDEAAGLIWAHKIMLVNNVTSLLVSEASPKKNWDGVSQTMTFIATRDKNPDINGFLTLSERGSERQFLLGFSLRDGLGIWMSTMPTRGVESLIEYKQNQNPSQKLATVEFRKGKSKLTAVVHDTVTSPDGPTEWIIFLNGRSEGSRRHKKFGDL